MPLPLSPVRRAWSWVAEPRHLTALYFVAYALTAVLGVLTLVYPPRGIEGELGSLLTAAWSIQLALGGSLGLVAVLPGWKRLEYIALTPLYTAGALLILITSSMRIDSVGSRIYLLALTSLVTLLYVIRAVILRLQRPPQTLSGRPVPEEPPIGEVVPSIPEPDPLTGSRRRIRDDSPRRGR